MNVSMNENELRKECQVALDRVDVDMVVDQRSETKRRSVSADATAKVHARRGRDAPTGSRLFKGEACSPHKKRELDPGFLAHEQGHGRSDGKQKEPETGRTRLQPFRDAGGRGTGRRKPVPYMH